jgi:hypothetical protein
MQSNQLLLENPAERGCPMQGTRGGKMYDFRATCKDATTHSLGVSSYARREHQKTSERALQRFTTEGLFSDTG